MLRQSSERMFSGGSGSLRKHKRGWEDPSVVGLDDTMAKGTSKRGCNGKTTIMSRGEGVA